MSSLWKGVALHKHQLLIVLRKLKWLQRGQRQDNQSPRNGVLGAVKEFGGTTAGQRHVLSHCGAARGRV